MPIPSNILCEVESGKGWALLPLLRLDSTNLIKEFIFSNFKRILFSQALIENSIRSFPDLESYHLTSIASEKHEVLWPKDNRLLDKESSLTLKSIFLNELSDIFSSFEISDEEKLAYPNIYWRLVRPYSVNDVGPAHRDSWFWIVAPHQTMPVGKVKRFKLWIPLIIVEGANALTFVSYSQLSDDYNWGTKTLDGRVKPYLIGNESDLVFEVADCKVGQPIIFSDDVIHKGPINRTERTRVSLEFTICVNDTDIL